MLFEHYCGVVVVVLVLSCLVEFSVSSICKFLLNEIKLLIRLFTRIIDFDLLFFFFFWKKIKMIFGSKLIILCNKGSLYSIYIYIYIMNDIFFRI